MHNEEPRLRELSAQGYCCSQIMVIMGLEAIGEEDPLLIEAMAALGGGARSGMLCGAITGACCMLALYDKDLAVKEMIPEFMATVKQEFASRYGSTDCMEILQGDKQNRFLTCPQLMQDVYRMAQEVLQKHGF